MEGTVPKGRFPLYRDFVPHRTSSRTWDEVRANQSGRLVCMSGLWPQGRCAAAAALELIFLVETRGGHRVSIGEFRALRSATRFHLDGPACAAGSRRASGPDPFSPAGGMSFPLCPRCGTKSICGNHRQDIQSFDRKRTGQYLEIMLQSKEKITAQNV